MPLSLTQPLIFEPIYKERVWGGRAMERVFGRKLPPEKCIGESWEIVDRPEAQSVVREGPLRGKTLHELWYDYREEIFGAAVADLPRFPILAKLLDARERLSLQVHPATEAAEALGGEIKTEMWYFVAAGKSAEIYAGLRRGVTRQDFEKAIEDGNVAELVHRMKVKAGDVFFVPSGRLHAIGAGTLLVEIQQNSDTTYRVFDWNRRDPEGEPRALHHEEAMRSIDFDDFEPQLVRRTGEELVRCTHFAVDRWDLEAPRAVSAKNTFALFVCLDGAVEIAGMHLAAGQFFLVPAQATRMTDLKPAMVATRLLRITLP